MKKFIAIIISVSAITFTTHVDVIKAQNIITGMGIMGASDSDEYRGTDNRAKGQYASVTFNWMEQLANTSSAPASTFTVNNINYVGYGQHKISRNINFGSWGTYTEPRRMGFAYNWARSGNQSHHLANQYPGLVQQVAQGLVSHVIIMMGQNDFNTLSSYGDYQEIYNNTLTDVQLAQKLNDINTDFNEAVDALKAANPQVKILVTNIGDAGLSTENITNFPIPAIETQMYCLLNNIPAGTPPCDPIGRLRVSYAIKNINSMLNQSLTPKGVYVADMNGWALQFLTKAINGYIYVDGIGINMMIKSNNPLHFQLADSIGHGGTVFGGLQANFIIDNLNTSFQTELIPFSECEILVNAGIKQPSQCPQTTATPLAQSPTITPSSILLGDINKDNIVNIQDYTLLSNAFGTNNQASDLDGNGTVNIQDFTILSNNFGKSI